MAGNGALISLVEAAIGAEAAEWVGQRVRIPGTLTRYRFETEAVHRAWLAEALNLSLFRDLVEAVPLGLTYVEESYAQGRPVAFDHGAIRTVDWHDNGELPRGRHAFSRILEPLGFADVHTYPLNRLRMTGYAYRHRDLPEEIAQFFVSELHPARFSDRFQEVVTRVVGNSRDPLTDRDRQTLERLRRTAHCSLSEAQELLPALHAAFDCRHATVAESDYDALLEESAEMAWIATEGNRFNHLTDRVDDLDGLVRAQRALGRPLKDAIEVSAAGTIRQTAYRACRVRRAMQSADGGTRMREVPGSFVEFIERHRDPDTGALDLGFDSGNAQGIFKMTDHR